MVKYLLKIFNLNESCYRKNQKMIIKIVLKIVDLSKENIVLRNKISGKKFINTYIKKVNEYIDVSKIDRDEYFENICQNYKNSFIKFITHHKL